MRTMGTLAEITRLITTTTLGLYVFYAFLIFFLNATIVVLFAQFVYPDELGSPQFGFIFLAFQTLVSFFYTKWAFQKASELVAPIISYLVLLRKTVMFEMRVNTVSHTTDHSIRHIGFIAAYLQAHHYKTYVPTFEVDQDFDDMLGFGLEADKIRKEPLVQLIHEKHESTWNDNKMYEFIEFAQRQCYNRLIDQPKFEWIVKPLEDFCEEISNNILFSQVYSPPIWDYTVKMIAVFHFLVLVPINYWGQSGAWFGILATALQTTTMILPYILKMWIGNVFAEDTPIALFNHRAFTMQTIRNTVKQSL